MNVAKYSPSGFYIASADKSGKVRIWDTVNKEHILKNEFQPISGPIKDLAWSSDNQRSVQSTLSYPNSWLPANYVTPQDCCCGRGP